MRNIRSILFSTLVFAVFANGVQASNARVILEYHFGNQTIGSDLTIREDGTVEHAERLCCPPHTDPVTETNLTDEARGKLLALIKAVEAGKTEETSGPATSPTSAFGYAIVFSSTGARITLRIVEGASTTGGLDKITTNTAPEAQSILEIAKSYVANKM